MGRMYPTQDPAESLFDYRVASDANKKLALGAKQWSMPATALLLGRGLPPPTYKMARARPDVVSVSRQEDRHARDNKKNKRRALLCFLGTIISRRPPSR